MNNVYIHREQKFLKHMHIPFNHYHFSVQQNKENNKPIKTSPDIFIILKWIPNDNFQIPIIFQTPLIAELGHYQFPLALEINF